MQKSAIVSLLCVCAMELGFARIIHVPSEQATIQQGLNLTSRGDTVLVARGLYVENIDFGGRECVLASNYILSGDATDIDSTIIDGGAGGSVVIFSGGENRSTVLQGFTLQNGFCEGHCIENDGAGVRCFSASPQLRNLIIRDNVSSRYGGGILFVNSGPALSDVRICNNTADYYGGAISSWFSAVVLSGVVMHDNSARYRGGGIQSDAFAEFLFDSENLCTIYDNMAAAGADLFCEHTMTVAVDSFTVVQPHSYHASPFSNFTFEIQNGKQAQIEADVYVSPEGNDLNAGTSPADAFGSVHHALSVLQVDESTPRSVYLAQGQYSPSGGGLRFPLPLASHVTLSGEGEGLTVFDGLGEAGIFYTENVNNAGLQNMSIRNGFEEIGAGICAYESGLEIANATFRANRAEASGAALAAFRSDLHFSNCCFTENAADFKGGALYLDTCTVAWGSLQRSSIYENHAPGGSDLYSNYPVTVVLDTFTVQNPTGYHARPIDNFTFDIQHHVREQISADLYVSAIGSDTSSGLSWEECFQTIGCALGNIQADSLHPRTIHVGPGTYSTALSHEFFPINCIDYVDIRGAGAGQTILDGNHEMGLFSCIGVAEMTIADMTLMRGYDEYGGGAIYIREASPILENVVMDSNRALGLGGSIYAGLAAPVLRNVTIQNGGTEWVGGAIYTTMSEVLIENSIFAGNSCAFNGGALAIEKKSSAMLRNVLLYDNSAVWGGGAVHLWDQSSVTLINATLAKNSGEYGGGINAEKGNTVNLINTVVRANSGGDISLYHFGKGNTLNAYHSCVKKSSVASTTDDTLHWLGGIMQDYPRFVDAGGFDFHLADDSRCIGGGSEFAVIEDVLYTIPYTDLEGNPRPNPALSSPDIGVYENELSEPLTAIEPDNALAYTFELAQNYPNPFNPSTRMEYEIPQACWVNIRVYSILGRQVASLVNQFQRPGRYSVMWNAEEYSSGSYFYRIEAGGQSAVRRCVLLK